MSIANNGKFNPLLVAAIVLIGALLAPRTASAHAILMRSQPASESAVAGPDVNFLLQYDSRVDASRSTLSLLYPGGEVRKLVMKRPPAPNDLAAGATGLTKGAYVLRWQALASDGHLTRGAIPFHVQ